MINYQNGKNFATIGFGLLLLDAVANTALDFFSIIMGGFPGFMGEISSILGVVSFLAFCLIVGGFGIMWLSEHKALDLAVPAVLVLSVLYSVLQSIFLVRALNTGAGSMSVLLSNLISVALTVALYGALAMRVKDKNKTLFLLLGCAVLYMIVKFAYNMFMPSMLPYELQLLVFGAGNIVCIGLCVLAVKEG